jgi:hypothetical protein
MLLWLLAALAGAAAALLQYGRGTFAPQTAPLAALRLLAALLLAALLLGAPVGRVAQPSAEVALDASESWLRAAGAGTGCGSWQAALDSASRLGGGRWLRFGDSLRSDAKTAPPTDRASAVRPVADRAAGTGRPVVVITDGELDDADALASLPAGSRTIVLRCRAAPDVAVSTLDVPRTLLAGDTATAQITLVAGEAGAPAGRVDLRLDDASLGGVNFASLAPFAELPLAVRVVPGGGARAAVLRAVVRAAGDREPRNDTLAVGVDVSRAPAAVFASTAPDYDAREAVAALRGVTSLPTRAYYRVAPGAWRTDGTLARVDESVVRAAVADAPLVVLHGDTSVFGAPRAATHGALLLFAPPSSDDGEWFASAAPPSPLAAALATLPFDSLPPLNVAAAMPRADWQGLLAHRGGASDDRRAALVGWDAPRRVAVLGASGLWRWRFRGGARADAYGTLMGTLYDWLAGARTDRRAVVPDGGVLRAGTPVRWRRGAVADSVVAVTVTRRSATGRVYSLALRFAEGAIVTESSPLAAGVYDVRTAGGTAMIVVNSSRELVPRRPTVTAGARGASGAGPTGAAPLLRERGWAFALLIALLCAEWVLRRRVGMR